MKNIKSNVFVNTLVVVSLLVLCSPVSYGQKEGTDLVVYNNGKEIKAVITGIDSANVYCMVWTEGYNVKRIIPKESVKSVLYCDGTVYQINPDSCSQVIKLTDKSDFELALDNFLKNMKESDCVISAGANVTFIKGDPEPLFPSGQYDDLFAKRIKLSYNVGFRFNSIINRRFAIHYGLEYSSKGLSLDRSNDSQENNNHGVFSVWDYRYNKFTFIVDYLQIPISVTFSPINWQSSLKTYGYLRGGIAPAVLIRSKYKYTTDLKRFMGIYYTRGSRYVEKLEGITPVDFNIFLAMGIRRWERFGFEAKYEMGLKNLKGEERLLNRAISINMVCYL